MPKLLRELTRLGDDTQNLSDVLFYESDRTPQQYKRIRKHPICRLGMGYLKTNIPDIPFVVHCEDDEIKAITEAMFKKIWRRMIFESLDKLEFGFKCCEILYEIGTLKYNMDDKKKEFEGLLLRTPRGLDAETISPSGILINHDGTLRGFQQDNDEKRTALVSDRKCLLFVNQYESGNWWGWSEYENIFQAWYDSNLNRQFGMRWLERIGTGHYVGKYPKGKTNIGGSEIDNADLMLSLLDSIMEGTVVAIPSDMDEGGNAKWSIELLSDENKTNAFIDKDRFLNELILQGLIIPEKALTQGEVGARSSIEAFQSMFIQRKQDILDTCVESVNEFMMPAFIIPNFGNDIECRIEAGQLDDDSRIKAGEIVKSLIEKGVIDVDKEWLEKKSGVPFEIVEVEEEPVIPEEPEEEIEEEPDPQEKKDEKVKEEVKEEKKKMSDIKLATPRQETEIEANFGMKDFGSQLETAEGELTQMLVNDLKIQMNRIINFLEKNSQDSKFIDVTDNIKVHEAPLKKIIDNYGRNVYANMFGKLETGTESDLNLAEPPKKFIGFRAGLTAKKFTTDLESELKFAISQAMNNEASKTEIINIPLRVFAEFIKRRLPTLVDTETGFFFNQARNDFVRENKKLIKAGKIPPEQEIQRLIYSAVLDDRTTELCRELDGTIVDVNSPLAQKFNPPLHFGCRSTWLPLTEEQISNNKTGLSFTEGKNGKPITSDQMTAKLGSIPINKSGTKTALDEITFR